MALVVFSFAGSLVLQQFLTFHRVPVFLQDPAKKPSRVRNSLKLNTAKLQGDLSFSLETFYDNKSHDQETEIGSSIATLQTRKDTGNHKISVPSTEIPGSIYSLRKQASSSSYQSNSGQQKASLSLDRRPRLPKALIIGFSKCGTAALRTFLTIHPDVVSPVLELRYFTLYYAKGIEWYRKQMPPSTKEQLTIEKTPAYIMSQESLRRIRGFDPKIKLIVIVRDPIVRLQSQYAHEFSHTTASFRPSFKQWWNEKPDDRSIINVCHYARYIRPVYDLFPRRQVLILSEDDMERNPLSVLKEAERFLELRPAYSDDMFVFNKEKGFHCFNTRSKLFPRVLTLVQVNRFTCCLGVDKGREHPQIGEDYLEHLIHVIRPLNEELFDLIGKRFQWKSFKDKS
ncbi:heparan sulfate glucosamine 3-O-sulfotransferase 3A1 [Elysia marginata]|uniref:Heparan sulfate glucosamine 3-O-sulfotransferase 3A1 n=1 Tax=Elysia marginata TaxID=1093978 RepID=A0AAV4ISC2_9GAST|nr:heparan sulfate glucosamine 3-O-sulfotransferase 3A1 [Elysia marginata]